jgi:hypothetical protein
MPADDRSGLNENQGFPPASPEAMQPHPENPAGEVHSRTLGLLTQLGQLLPQREVL